MEVATVERGLRVVFFCRIAMGGAMPADFIHIRLLHALQELPRVSRQRFHVAALALGVDGVENQRRFAGAGYTGDHGQQIVRNRERDVLEVVDSRSTDEYGFFQGMFRERRALAPPVFFDYPRSVKPDMLVQGRCRERIMDLCRWFPPDTSTKVTSMRSSRRQAPS